MFCAIPVEIVIRELDGVLYLALHLAALGLSSLVGDTRLVNRYACAARGSVIYFDSDQHLPTNRAILDQGGAVFNLNAEGLNQVESETDIRGFARVASAVTRILAWGDVQYRALAGLVPPDRTDCLRITGYPSFDLACGGFLPYYHNERIIREHGRDYILVNTNFALSNHKMGFDQYVRMLSRMPEWDKYGNPEYVARLRMYCEYQERLGVEFVRLVDFLAREFPGRHVILRPHPAEKEEYYTRRLGALGNVFVDNSGAAREWIATAGAVIHHDCTTGLEALLMGKPVVQYRPILEEDRVSLILARAGLPAARPEEAAAVVRNGDLPADSRREMLEFFQPYLANITGDSSQIISALAAEQARALPQGALPRPQGAWDQLVCWRKHLSKLLRARQPGSNGRKVRYALNKFPRLSPGEIRGRLDRLRSLVPGLPRTSVKQMAMNTFLLEPQDPSGPARAAEQ